MTFFNTRTFSFGITLLLAFSWFGLIQSWTNEDAEKRNLKCWECESYDAGFCTGRHNGQSALCPSEEYPPDNGVDTLDGYRCLIMKVVDEETNRTKIMKGCSSLAYDFIKDSNNESVAYHTRNGCSDPISGRFILAEDKKFYKIHMCFCDKTDCNKFEIDGIGMEGRNLEEEMEQRSFAPSFLNSFWLQLCCFIAIGVERWM